MAKGSKAAMRQMEHWTPKETPRVVDGKQSHRPLVPGGWTLSLKKLRIEKKR